MRRSLAVSVFLLSMAAPLWAQTQHDMHVEADREARDADRDLARVRAELLDSLSPEEERDLIRADKAFELFRDAEVEFEASHYRGGSLAPTEACYARAAITKERARRLESNLAYRRELSGRR